MSKNTWIPLILAVIFQGFSLALSLILPETLPIAESRPKPNITSLDGSSRDTDNQRTHEGEPITKSFWGWVQQVKQSYGFVCNNTAIAALVFTFLISKVGRQSLNILLQYVSKRYEWSLAKAGLLLSLRAGVNLALFTVILPTIAALTLSKVSANARDVWIARASISLMMIGTVIMFVSSTPVFMIIGLITFTLGTGFTPIIRSVVTTLAQTHAASRASDVGRLYALISVVEGIGSLIAGPGMAWSFRVGMVMGECWLGLPFGLATILFLIVSVVVFSIRI